MLLANRKINDVTIYLIYASLQFNSANLLCCYNEVFALFLFIYVFEVEDDANVVIGSLRRRIV